ncbi:hypothetical protein L6164_012920 [Bauhinia variegata]|uniref:Uncharacterized protein n=1 Tax=Bauhinia variegata TaxID=167791 RepID=A0ACB9PBP8_BAUVA|nr:hypothetical protein L6164_012920 [Bauhinia variegata]
MSNKQVKGLLKGLRYISHIFEEEKEDEIQIGFPTDVKHVAHIGWDGPSASTPSWMQDFKSSETSSEAAAPSEAAAAVQPNEIKDKKSKAGGSRQNKDIPTPRSRHGSIDQDSQPISPSRRSSDGSRHGRRHRSSDSAGDSGSSKPRRHRHSHKEAESQSNDTSSSAPAPKGTRRRKTKTSSSGDGSVSSKAGSISDISEIGSEF